MNIELDRVYTFKLTNADEVVAKVVAVTDDAYEVAQPLSAVPTEKGLQLIYTVFTGNPKENATINKTCLLYTSDAADE